jgi:sugar phosphate permease
MNDFSWPTNTSTPYTNPTAGAATGSSTDWFGNTLGTITGLAGSVGSIAGAFKSGNTNNANPAPKPTTPTSGFNWNYIFIGGGALLAVVLAVVLFRRK